MERLDELDVSLSTHIINWDEYLKDIDLLGDTLEKYNLHNHYIIGLLPDGGIPAINLCARFKQKPSLVYLDKLITNTNGIYFINDFLIELIRTHKTVLFLDGSTRNGKLVQILMDRKWPEGSDVQCATMHIMCNDLDYLPNVYTNQVLMDNILFPYEMSL